MKTATFSMVDRVPEGGKPVSSKWYFDYKTDKEGKITEFKRGWLSGDSRRSITWITPTHFPPVRHQHRLSWYSR